MVKERNIFRTNELRISKFVVENGPSTISEISQSTKVDYANLHRAAMNLVNNKIIEIVTQTGDEVVGKKYKTTKYGFLGYLDLFLESEFSKYSTPDAVFNSKDGHRLVKKVSSYCGLSCDFNSCLTFSKWDEIIKIPSEEKLQSWEWHCLISLRWAIKEVLEKIDLYNEPNELAEDKKEGVKSYIELVNPPKSLSDDKYLDLHFIQDLISDPDFETFDLSEISEFVEIKNILLASKVGCDIFDYYLEAQCEKSARMLGYYSNLRMFVRASQN